MSSKQSNPSSKTHLQTPKRIFPGPKLQSRKPKPGKTMNTAVISRSEPNSYFCSNPGKVSRPGNISSAISFPPRTTKSRISIENRSGSCRARRGCQVQALYTPAAAAATQTLYEVLGITDVRSSLSYIKKAYRKMARKYHPDVSPPERVAENTGRFIRVQEAYETLSNPQTRASYDSYLAWRGSGFKYSSIKSQNNYQQNMEEYGYSRMKWQSQLDGLKQRDSSKGSMGSRMSWGARIRSQK